MISSFQTFKFEFRIPIYNKIISESHLQTMFEFKQSFKFDILTGTKLTRQGYWEVYDFVRIPSFGDIVQWQIQLQIGKKYSRDIVQWQ